MVILMILHLYIWPEIHFEKLKNPIIRFIMKITQKNIFPSQLVDNLVCLAFDKDSFNVKSFSQYNQPQPSRLKKAVVKRQAEYLAGRICASQALKAIGYSNAIVETSENRAPIWPDKTLGAITHTKGIAMAVALHSHKAKGIGIDVEKHMSAEQEIQLQNHIFIEDDSECKTFEYEDLKTQYLT